MEGYNIAKNKYNICKLLDQYHGFLNPCNFRLVEQAYCTFLVYIHPSRSRHESRITNCRNSFYMNAKKDSVIGHLYLRVLHFCSLLDK